MISLRYAKSMLPFLLVSSTTVGDGIMEKVHVYSSGWWLLKNYVATIPNQLLDDSLDRVFSLDAIKTNNNLHIALSFISETEIQFVNTNPIIEFVVSTKEGEVFRANQNVFSHYFHMRKAGKALWPSNDEWLCDFDWGVEYTNRAIPFRDDLPKKAKRLSCNVSIENPKEELEIAIRCLNCNTDVPLTVGIEFTSSWK